MSVFRVEKSKNYTVMSNHHLRNTELSLRAKGLLSQILSLPEGWDYTIAGLAKINKEGKDAVRAAVQELEKAGYIERRQTMDSGGKFGGNEYVVYESPRSVPPLSENPTTENPSTEKPLTGNPTQLSKEELSKDNNPPISPRRGAILPLIRLRRPKAGSGTARNRQTYCPTVLKNSGHSIGSMFPRVSAQEIGRKPSGHGINWPRMMNW